MGRKKTGEEIPCEICGKKRYFHYGKIKKQKHFYCSIKCTKGKIVWNKGLTKDCDERLKIISEKTKQQLKREYKSGIRNRDKITQKAVQAVREKSWERFLNNPRMYTSKRGYLMIYVPQRGDVKYHHYVWEQKTKKKVPAGMHLHHKDGNRFNNEFENLQLLTNSEHQKLHYEEDREAIRENKGQFLSSKNIEVP